MRFDVAIAAGVMLMGAVVLVWALVRRRHVYAPQPILIVMPLLENPPRPRRRFAKGSVEFATVEGDSSDGVERPRTLRPSHARRMA